MQNVIIIGGVRYHRHDQDAIERAKARETVQENAAAVVADTTGLPAGFVAKAESTEPAGEARVKARGRARAVKKDDAHAGADAR